MITFATIIIIILIYSSVSSAISDGLNRSKKRRINEEIGERVYLEKKRLKALEDECNKNTRRKLWMLRYPQIF